MKKLSGIQRAELSLMLIILAYLVVLIYYTPQYSEKAAFFPKIVLTFCGILLTGKLLSLFFPRFQRVLEPEKKHSDKDISGLPLKEEPEEKVEVSYSKVIIMITWIIGTALSFYLLGIIIASTLATLVFFLVFSRMRWVQAFLFSFMFGALLFVIFNMLLRMRLFTGILF